jgi:glycolate oxidase FAD binding subunit
MATGAGTKLDAKQLSADYAALSTLRLKGIVEYEPEEFTFTALAGTPLDELGAALEKHGQYMPFDPLFVHAGTTLGGTVSAGASGPGQFRYGSVRDFILGVRFVDGTGRLLRMGGKVVKNAAGFDLPKFLVGSLGRFGILAEVTCKVFPRPASTLTLLLHADTVERSTRILLDASRARWDVDALDIPPPGNAVALRLAGPASALAAMSKEILGRWPGETLSAEQADGLWTELGECRWAHGNGVLVRTAIAPGNVVALVQRVRGLEGGRIHVSAGGNVGHISLSTSGDVEKLDEMLRADGLRGAVLRGAAPSWLGAVQSTGIAQAVKDALDPDRRFPALEASTRGELARQETLVGGAAVPRHLNH